MKFLLSLAFAIALFSFKGPELVHWKVTEAYSVKWGKTSFRGLKAMILFNEENPARSKITASIEANSVSTENAEKTAHTKEALYTDKYRIISFESTAIKKISAGRYEATGKLTLKGITRDIVFPFSFDSRTNLMDRFPMVPKQTFQGLITIVPKDYNITREGTPQEMSIELVIPVTK